MVAAVSIRTILSHSGVREVEARGTFRHERHGTGTELARRGHRAQLQDRGPSGNERCRVCVHRPRRNLPVESISLRKLG